MGPLLQEIISLFKRQKKTKIIKDDDHLILSRSKQSDKSKGTLDSLYKTSKDLNIIKVTDFTNAIIANIPAALSSTSTGSTIEFTENTAYKFKLYFTSNAGLDKAGFSQYYFNRDPNQFRTSSWFQYGEGGYSPAYDNAFDASTQTPSSPGGSGVTNLSLDMYPMLEESVFDELAKDGFSSKEQEPLAIYSNDVMTLTSLKIPLYVATNDTFTENDDLTISIVDLDSTTGNPTIDTSVLPSTVKVYFVDSQDTSVDGKPQHHLVWAGADTKKGILDGAVYTAGATVNLSGVNGAQNIARRFYLVFEDEYYSNLRSTYLKVTGGRVVFEDLPTTDPQSKGVLWNDNGDLKISLG